jgi:hypothetical protein
LEDPAFAMVVALFVISVSFGGTWLENHSICVTR